MNFFVFFDIPIWGSTEKKVQKTKIVEKERDSNWFDVTCKTKH